MLKWELDFEMLTHIVMWKLRDPLSPPEKSAALKEIKRRLEALVGQIPEIGKFEIGIDISRTSASYDIVLYSTFASPAALDAYRRHPAHVAVADFIATVVSDRKVIDYSITQYT